MGFDLKLLGTAVLCVGFVSGCATGWIDRGDDPRTVQGDSGSKLDANNGGDSKLADSGRLKNDAGKTGTDSGVIDVVSSDSPLIDSATRDASRGDVTADSAIADSSKIDCGCR